MISFQSKITKIIRIYRREKINEIGKNQYRIWYKILRMWPLTGPMATSGLYIHWQKSISTDFKFIYVSVVMMINIFADWSVEVRGWSILIFPSQFLFISSFPPPSSLVCVCLWGCSCILFVCVWTLIYIIQINILRCTLNMYTHILRIYICMCWDR